MITIKIDDTFCEWTYYLEGLDELSIQQIIDIIKEQTGAEEIKAFLSKTTTE